MRILHIINNLNSGGAEKLIEIMLPQLNMYHEVELLMLENNGNTFEQSLSNKRIKIYNLGFSNIYSPLNIFKIHQFTRKNHYDLIHVHLFPAQYWTALSHLLPYKSKPLVITTEHSTQNNRRKLSIFRLIDRLIYNNFDSIICISKSTQNNLLNWIGKEKFKNKTIVIQNGIELNKFQSIKMYDKANISEDIGENDFLLCMVGRLSKEKDQLTIIKSLELLDDDVKLILVGVGTNKETLVSYIAQKKVLKNRVIFLGFRDDIPSILKSSDVVILSSHYEGFGLAAVEGMAAGKPVIASNVDGLNEIVNDTRVLFETGNYRQLATIIDRIQKDPVFLNELINDNIENAKKYSIDFTIEQYLKVYNDMGTKND